MVPLADIAAESTEAILPAEWPTDAVVYVGLENVEPVTGEPVGLEQRSRADIRSRSRVFGKGQLLYGRLRPYLRKVFLAAPPFERGICSTEFIVMSPNTKIVVPELLRALLASPAATAQLARFQIGAALPRISARDFFSISLPIPPLDVQQAWLQTALRLRLEYRDAKQVVNRYPNAFDTSVNSLIAGDVGGKAAS